MEYVEGVKLSEVIAGDDPKYNKILIADRIVRAYLKQIFLIVIKVNIFTE